jgi:hypothetical protein
MKFFVKQASVVALATLLTGVASARKAGPTSANVVPGGYVVELESTASVSIIRSWFTGGNYVEP